MSRMVNGLEVLVGDIWSFEKETSVRLKGEIKTILVTSLCGTEDFLYFNCLDIKENKRLMVYFDDSPEVYTLVCRG